MVIRNLLKATDEGLGHGETPIFPVQVFKTKEGVNYNPGDPNYDLFRYSMEVSARRLFPNYTFLDAPFNLKYYKPGHIESEVATMGCVSGSEVIKYSIDDVLYIEPFEIAYNRVLKYVNESARQGNSEYIDTSKSNIKIYDTHSEKLVQVKKFIRNSKVDNWRTIKFKDGQKLSLTGNHPLPVIGKGRLYADDIKPGDKIARANIDKLNGNTELKHAWFIGLLTGANARYRYNKIEVYADYNDSVINKLKNGMYPDIFEFDKTEESIVFNCVDSHYILETEDFCGCSERIKVISTEIFNATEESKIEFLAGMLENAYVVHNAKDKTCLFRIENTSKSLINSLYYFLKGIGLTAKIGDTVTTCGNLQHMSAIHTYHVDFNVTEKILSKTSYKYRVEEGNIFILNSLLVPKKESNVVEVEYIKNGLESGESNSYSYDVETESDRFDVSGIQSHNCRTRVMSNIYDPEHETSISRGNLSFTTINLPRLAIKASNGVKGHGDIKLFFSLLDEMMELVHKQLLERFEVQCRKHPRNYPFLMGQGVWLGTDELGPDDDIREVLKQGTLSIGMIGLAETLTMLIGKHHGESEEAQQLGLKIIGHMRELTDKWSQEEKMNYGIIGTPAEGLSGRFIKIDQRIYGKIPGVTDKEYYTNSSHIRVDYNISAFDKIELEAPYHELENAGHICYVELDGDPLKNIDAFEAVVRCMHDAGIGYGAINHPVDRDPVCGYVGIIDDVCPRCGRREGEPMTLDMWKRIKGYSKTANADYCGTCGDPYEEQDRVTNKVNK